jgi:hypothetical protein
MVTTMQKGLDLFSMADGPWRYSYPDILARIGKRGLLRPFYLWALCRFLDSPDWHRVKKRDLFDYCQAQGIWGVENVKDLLAAGNDVLWQRPEGRNKGPHRGYVRYRGPRELLEVLGIDGRSYEARLLPEDCLSRGFDYWLRCELEAYTSHAEAKPCSRDYIQEETGISPSTQRRVGFAGERNVEIRSIVEGDDLSKESLTDNRYMRWSDDELLKWLASSYEPRPIIPADLHSVPADCGLLDYYPSDAFYLWHEDEQLRGDRPRYLRYVIRTEGLEIVPHGRGHTALAHVWEPGRKSKLWDPIQEDPKKKWKRKWERQLALAQAA